MTLPEPTSAFPAPVSAFPAPSIAPSYGLSVQAPSIQSVLPGAFGAPTLAGNPTPASTEPGLTLMDRITGGAVGTGNDPRTWTLSEAQAQTDRALARIGQANPSLAATIAEQVGRDTGQQQSGGGFWHGLMGAVGDVLQVTHLDDVLELMGRSAHILPEVVMDWGKESVWKNLGDAISGHSDVSWDDVLVEKLGMERNWFTATLGFIGDVATDPLTYATLGAGAVGRKVIGETAAKAVLVGEGERVLGKVATEGVTALTEKELATHAFFQTAFDAGAQSIEQAAGQVLKTAGVGAQAAEKASQGILGRAMSTFKAIHPDAMPGVIATSADDMAKAGLDELTHIADMAVKQATTGGFGKASAELAQKLGIDKSYAENVLRRWAREGTGLHPGFGTKAAREAKGLYTRGQAAAATLGGFRFHLNVPILGLRLSPTRLLPKVVPQLDFSMARRFTAGIFGERRLEKMVAAGTEGATADDLRLFWEGSANVASGTKGATGGYDLLKVSSPAVAKKLAGGSLSRFGSTLIKRSEQIGRITSHLSPHAAMYRGGGLASFVAADMHTLTTHIGESLMTEARTVTLGDKTLDPRAVDELTARAFAIGRKSTDAEKEVVFDALHDWSRFLPKEAGYGDSVDEMLANVAQNAPELLPIVQQNEARLRELETYLKGQGNGEGWFAAQAHRMQLDQTSGILADHGIAQEGNIYPLMHADSMNPTEAARASSEGAVHVRGKRFRAVGEQGKNAGRFDQSLDETVLDDGTARGLLVEEVPGASISDGGARAAEQAAKRKVANARIRAAEQEYQAAKLTMSDGLFTGDATSLLDRIDAAKQELFDAKAELRAVDEEGSDLVVYAKNGLTVDKRTGAGVQNESSLPGNLPEELAAQYNAVMDKIRAASKTLAGTSGERQIVEQQEKVAAVITRKLQAMGYDHLREIDEAGNVRLTIFRQADGGMPVSRLDAHAPWVRDQGSLLGHSGLAATDEAYKAVHRSKVRDLPGGSEKWLEENIRDVARLSRGDAERELRRRMEKEGVALLPNQRILEADPLKAMDLHAGRAVSKAKRKILGQAGRQLESLGLGSSVLNGYAVGVRRYKYVLDTDLLAAVEKMGQDVRDASDAGAQIQKEALVPLTEEAKRAADDLGAHLEMVRDAMSALDSRDMNVVAGEEAPAVNAALQRLAVQLDDPANKIHGEFRSALSEGRAVDMGDGVWAVPREDGGVRFYAVEHRAAQGEVAPPLGTTSVPDGWGLFTHETRASAVPSIQTKGILAKDASGEGRNVVFAWEGTHGASRATTGAVPEGDVVIEFKAPLSEMSGAGDTAARRLFRDVPPSDIIGVHPPGSNQVVAYRDVDGTGLVSAVTAKSVERQGYGTKLVRAHWGTEGVFDAPDPIAAAAEQVKKQGAISHAAVAMNRKVINELSAGLPQPNASQLKQASVHLDRTIADIGRVTDETGGATLDLTSGTFKAIGKDSGFSVAMKPGTGSKVSAADWADPVKREAAIRSFFDANPELATFRAHLGTWKDDAGDVHLDVSEVVKSRDEALALGQARNQEAVFDLKTGQEIAVPSEPVASPAATGRTSVEGIRRQLQRNVDEAQARLEGANLEHAASINEVNRLNDMLTTETARVRPALVPVNESALNAAGFERLDIPGFEDLAMPSFMAQEFKQALRGFKGIEGIHSEFRKFNAWWKSQATWMWPGFHIRNFYGAFFNNLLGGVSIADYVLSGRVQRAMRELSDTGAEGKWAKSLLRDTGNADLIDTMKRNGNLVMYGKSVDDLTYGDLARMSGGVGITAGNGRAFGESRVLGSAVERENRKGLLGKVPGGALYTRKAKGAGTLTENTMRIAAFSKGLRSYGTMTEARAFTMMRHGDYADLTDFEYGTVRDLIPFYKWMRTNVPFQIHQLLESPGKLLAVQKAQGAVFTGAGLDYDQAKYKMPAWMGDTFVLPFGAKDDGTFETALLDIPMSDLHMSGREFVSSFLPAVRPVLESYVFDQSTFTGAPIDGKRIPLAGIFNVPGIRDVLSATGFAEKGPDGQLYTTDQKQNLLAAIPVFSRARNWMYADPDRTGLRMNAVASAMFGVTPRTVDQDAMTSAELDYYYTQVEPLMTHLKQMGYPLPTTADIEAALGSVDAALTNLGITPSAGTAAAAPSASILPGARLPGTV